MKIPDKYVEIINNVGYVVLLLSIIYFYIAHPEYQQIILTISGIGLLSIVAFIILFCPLTILMILMAIFVYIHEFFTNKKKRKQK